MFEGQTVIDYSVSQCRILLECWRLNLENARAVVFGLFICSNFTCANIPVIIGISDAIFLVLVI